MIDSCLLVVIFCDLDFFEFEQNFFELNYYFLDFHIYYLDFEFLNNSFGFYYLKFYHFLDLNLLIELCFGFQFPY